MILELVLTRKKTKHHFKAIIAAVLVEIEKTLHIGKVAFSYYQIQRSIPAVEDYVEWLESLQEPQKSHFQGIGYEQGKAAADFLQFFTNLRDREMQEYMQEHLSKEDYLLWLAYRHTPSEK